MTNTLGSRSILDGSSGVPISEANTSYPSSFRVPAFNLASPWRARCAFSASTVRTSRWIVRPLGATNLRAESVA
ncbi:MAG TPA: hypothetical protein VIZ60_03175 [Rubrobacter sp.]